MRVGPRVSIRAVEIIDGDVAHVASSLDQKVDTLDGDADAVCRGFAFVQVVVVVVVIDAVSGLCWNDFVDEW